MRLLALLLAAAAAHAAGPVLGPYSTAINISLDLAGKPDPRGGTWGKADSYKSVAKFAAPAGYRTRVLRVYGDFIAWPRDGIIPHNTRVEVGFGLKTSAPDGSRLVSYPGYAATPYDNSFVWIQDALDENLSVRRVAVSENTSAGGLLEPDNILYLQSFVALNTTGLTIHMEPTVVVVFQFEPNP